MPLARDTSRIDDMENVRLFEDTTNSWQKEWVGMPEYDNKEQEQPVITATFKFRSIEDFEKFKAVVQEHLYNGQKVFDGMQRKDVKSAWYPLKEKAGCLRCL